MPDKDVLRWRFCEDVRPEMVCNRMAHPVLQVQVIVVCSIKINGRLDGLIIGRLVGYEEGLAIGLGVRILAFLQTT